MTSKKQRYTVFIGADHRGFELKGRIIDAIKKLGHEVVDAGSYDPAPCDYPAISYEVATHVVRMKNARGILLCLTGIGHSIAANKVPGAYAALCYNKEAAVLSRQHNNANILVLGANFVPEKKMIEVIETWLATEFEGGRHLRRLKQIKVVEKKLYKSFK
jgi:RpiB/LacA/LacB family sugar-phosphate isomerase